MGSGICGKMEPAKETLWKETDSQPREEWVPWYDKTHGRAVRKSPPASCSFQWPHEQHTIGGWLAGERDRAWPQVSHLTFGL